MDSLLPELAAKVAWFLTPRDLAACCAVSVHWREVFGTNQVWKRLCDLEMEEHLRTTPCIVEPVFSVYSAEDSTLTPLSRWRLAFLREQHLWSNWQKDNFKHIFHQVEGKKESLEQFITNDFIVSFQSKSLQLWDVRPVPPVRVGSLEFENEMHYTPTVFSNGYVILKSGHYLDVKIYKVDLMESTILWKHQFLFNRITQTPELVCANTRVSSEISWVNFVVIIKENFCLGYFCFDSYYNSFYVWDLESGVQLKQESLPTSLLEGGFCVVSSETCDEVLVLVPLPDDSEPSERPIANLQCRVYDVKNLIFLPFSQTCSVFPELLSGSMQYFEQCAITKNFVALSDCDSYDVKSIRIFNYRTDQQMYMLEANSGVHVLSEGCFIFKYQKYSAERQPVEERGQERLCAVFCSTADIVEDVTGFDVKDFEVTGDRLVTVYPSNEIWRINRFSSFKTRARFYGFQVNRVNKACTKVLRYVDLDRNLMIGIYNFW